MRVPRWLLITSGVLVSLVVVVVIGWTLLSRYFIQQYMETSYRPERLAAAPAGELPASVQLTDVPWIATAEPYCAATSLQMVALQRGTTTTLGEVNFLMGFPYGASNYSATNLNPWAAPQPSFFPFTDPEAGTVAAAPYLGLERHFYVTDDTERYLQSVRAWLARGYPVRVSVDMAALYPALEGDIPHHDLLVGYDQAGFQLYETVCLPDVPCEPGYHAPGTPGLYVSNEQLLQAVTELSRLFSYPWRYSFAVYVPAEQQTDLRPIFARNAGFLIGGTAYGPKQGVDAILATADAIARDGPRLVLDDLRFGFATAVYTRRDIAAFLADQFPGDSELQRAAGLFERAAARYQAALDATADGIGDDAEAALIAGWLREAAEAERSAGQIFLAHGP